MALKDWRKKGDNWYVLKRNTSVQIWIESSISSRKRTRFYDVMHQYEFSAGRAEPISGYLTKSAAHSVLMEHIRKHDW